MLVLLFLTGRSPARLNLSLIPGQKQINRRTLTLIKTYIDKDRLLLPEAMKQTVTSQLFWEMAFST